MVVEGAMDVGVDGTVCWDVVVKKLCFLSRMNRFKGLSSVIGAVGVKYDPA